MVKVEGAKSKEKPKARTDKRLGKAEKKLPELQKQAKNLQDQVDSLNLEGLGGPEAVFKAEYHKMLRFNSRLIRRMNDQLKEQLSSRDIYALSTLMSQQREVIADLRTIVDMSEQVTMVERQVLIPFVSDATQLLTDVYFQLRKLLAETTIPKQTQFSLRKLDELVQQFGMGMQASHESSKEKLYQILLGDRTATPPTKKRKRSA